MTMSAYTLVFVNCSMLFLVDSTLHPYTVGNICKNTMKPAVKWPLDMSVMERLSWRFQSAVVIGLVGLSSKIFLGRCTRFELRESLQNVKFTRTKSSNNSGNGLYFETSTFFRSARGHLNS